MDKRRRRQHELRAAISTDLHTIESRLGPFTPELRKAIRWAALRAAAREIFNASDELREQGDNLDDFAVREDW